MDKYRLGMEIISAASTGNKVRVVELIGSGANIEATDAFGRTALHNAAHNGHVECVEALLSHGSIIGTTSVCAETALCSASRYSYPGVLEVVRGWQNFMKFLRNQGLAMCMSLHHRLGSSSTLHILPR